ncbi:hypothetical protein L6452_35976 [Arctium lappa]|uniref:Uncharacterized protein n=1 Tax=Arctium lappa TaxID=4217 RepID=A0ACB8Y809_ARCLA|nr:hypothetical protein L6452_35976 [Arctium lappa]
MMLRFRHIIEDISYLSPSLWPNGEIVESHLKELEIVRFQIQAEEIYNSDNAFGKSKLREVRTSAGMFISTSKMEIHLWCKNGTSIAKQ